MKWLQAAVVALTAGALLAWLAAPIQARAAQAPPADARPADGAEQRSLPPEVQAALRHARIPPQAVSVVVQELISAGVADGNSPASLSWQPDTARNPASLAKLLTTAAALDELGPAWRWRTPVWLDGPVQGGVLRGNLHLQGRGDPQLQLEQLWRLLRRVQAQGVQQITGDIVLDNSLFRLPPGHAADFDGEPLRPYNVRADALLLNQHAKIYSFRPDAAAGVVRISVEPPLAGAVVDSSVPLAPSGPCGDWRARLQADFGVPLVPLVPLVQPPRQPTPLATSSQGTPVPEPEPVVRVRFKGAYPLACGELNWAVADPHPDSYNARLLAGLWRSMGGVLTGRVRSGPPPAIPPSFEHRSPDMAEVVRDINKFSNNVMAQQLFLTLAAEAAEAAEAAKTSIALGTAVTPDDARAHLRAWLESRLGAEALAGLAPDALVVDNGSGLSRGGRITARLLARLLTQVYDSPQMPEFMASLPIGGVDGTLRRSRVTPGRAHLKTGSLRDVNALAGYALSHSGRRYVLVAIVNHANAGAARPALDAVVQWTLNDMPLR